MGKRIKTIMNRVLSVQKGEARPIERKKEVGDKGKILLSTIERFVEHRMYQYALLIDGEWGSGKTFFVQEYLIPFLKEKKYNVNYISLYGVSETSEIDKKICIQAIKAKNPKLEKIIDSKGGQITTSIGDVILKTFLSQKGINDINMYKVIESLPDYDNNVIVFDDIERCACDINELLGYINNFVEHSKASVILIANEKEIGNWQLDRNPELQMMVALNPSIDVFVEPTQEEKLNQIFGVPNKNESSVGPKTYSIEQIEERRKKVFHSNEKYLRMKEKVIGQTVKYEPDVEPVFISIIQNRIYDESLKMLLIGSVKKLTAMAQSECHINLRTFQFYLEKISSIFRNMKGDFSIFHQAIIEYTYRSSIEYMKGRPMPKWEGEYGNMLFDGDNLFSSGILGFRFIDEYIVSNHLNIDEMNRILAQCCLMETERGNLKNDPSQLIRSWWLAEDDQLLLWLSQIQQNIHTGKYSTALYTEILHHLADIVSRTIMVQQCNEIVDTMENYILETDTSALRELDPEHFFTEGDAAKKYQEWIGRIRTALQKKFIQSEKERFEEAIIDTKNWAENLDKLAANAGSVKGFSFIYWLDPARIVELIRISKNVQLEQFRFALQNYYGDRVFYENMTKDIDHLETIAQLLPTVMEEAGEIKKCLISLIVQDINQYIQKIKRMAVK